MKDFFAGNPVSRDYRAMADKLCQPQMERLVVIYLIYTLIIIFSVASSLIFQTESTRFISSIGSVLGSICTFAFAFSSINIAKNEYLGIEVKTDDLFYGFNHFTRALCVNALVRLYTILWFLIPVVGPFIAAVKICSYSMATYIAIDNPKLGYNECITKSREMMNGNKWKYFCLSASYIGWIVLSLLTFGILLLWIYPKIQQAKFLFYLKVSGIGLQVELARERLKETNK